MSHSNTPEPPGTERALRSTARNPRRRQRQSDGESIKSAPRRKRSKVSEDSFVPPKHDEEMNGTLEIPDVPKMNGNANHTPTASIESRRARGRPKKESMAPGVAAMDIDMPLREKKKVAVKRTGTRGDGATVMTQNSRYVVRMLPSTPREVRKEGIEYRGSLGADHHALAITRERAYIWDYTSHTPVSNPRVFDVPFKVRASDPLPHGSLVTSAGSAETGLVLVSSTTGKVVFYESVERAASLGLFQESSTGIEGSLGSLFSGETVSELVSADHAGFVIVLSSGRIAQVALRDAQGKARVSTQFLRAADQGSNGMLGSFLGLLGGGAWKRDVAAVHNRPLGTKGQMQVLSLTEQAELQMWDLDWNGRYTFRGTVEFKEAIKKELLDLEAAESQGQLESLMALDFVVLEGPVETCEVTTFGSEHPIELLLLLKTGAPGNHKHMILEIGFEGEEVTINRVLQLDTYQKNTVDEAEKKPRLLLSKPKHTAMVFFEDAVVLLELSDVATDTPEAQLHASYVQPEAFEDAVFLQPGNQYSILGACEEEARGGYASALAFVKSAGLVRVSAADPKTTEQESRISTKSKMEQAVFHGALQEHNILDFSRRMLSKYSVDDVEAAALQLSEEVLKSTSPFISTTPPSIDTHLLLKVQALRALVIFVRQNYPALSSRTMWRLLWDAEKVAAGQAMWQAFEYHVSETSQIKRTGTILDEVCAELEGSDSGEVVRDFFIHNLHNLERLLPQTQQVLHFLRQDASNTGEKKLQMLWQGNDLWIKAMETVFAFRLRDASLYGINPEVMADGVLTDDVEYMQLPEFWTSTETMLKAVVKLADQTREFAAEVYTRIERDDQADQAASLELIRHISSLNPRLVELLCLIYQERIHWLGSRPREQDKHMAAALQHNYDQTRHDQLRALANLGQTEQGLKLAERFKDMDTLTHIVVGEMQYAISALHAPDGHDEESRSAILARIDELTARVGRYFERFGEAWADAYFDEGFSGSTAGLMLRDAQENWPDALTRYLRADERRARMAWINEVLANDTFELAGANLRYAAREQEDGLWAQKVELSMAKLAFMAAEEDKPENEDCKGGQSLMQHWLDLAKIQERVCRHITPEVQSCIDRQAEVEVAMQKVGQSIEDLHALRQMLETYVERLLNHKILPLDDLIDLLTLMDPHIVPEADYNLRGQEFVWALKALDLVAPTLPQGRFETLLGLIWKRCYSVDDWHALNEEFAQRQNEELDADVYEVLRATALWRTLFYSYREHLFADRHSVRQLWPADCVGAGCSLQELSHRWPYNPELVMPIVADNRTQGEQLQDRVDNSRLERWVEACITDAKRLMQNEAKTEAEDERLLREMGSSMREREKNELDFDQPVKLENGEDGEEGHSDLGESIEVDADEAGVEE